MIESLTLIVWFQIIYALLIGIIVTVKYRSIPKFSIRAILSWLLYFVYTIWLLDILGFSFISLDYIIPMAFLLTFITLAFFGLENKNAKIVSGITIIYGILFAIHIFITKESAIPEIPYIFLLNLIVTLTLSLLIAKFTNDIHPISMFGMMLALSLLEFIKAMWGSLVPPELTGLTIGLTMFLSWVGIRDVNIKTTSLYLIFPLAVTQNIGMAIVNYTNMDMFILFVGRVILDCTLLMFIILFYYKYHIKESQALKYMLYTIFLILINNYLNTIYYINLELVDLGYTYLVARAPFFLGSIIAYIGIYSLLYAAVVGKVPIGPVKIIEKIFIAFVSSLITLIAVMIGYQQQLILPLYIFLFYLFFIPSLLISVISFILGGIKLIKRGKTLTGIQSVSFAILALLVIVAYGIDDAGFHMISGILFSLTAFSFIVYGPDLFESLKIKLNQEIKSDVV